MSFLSGDPLNLNAVERRNLLCEVIHLDLHHWFHLASTSWQQFNTKCPCQCGKKTEERPHVWQLKDHLLILYSYIQRIMSHVLAPRHLLICWSQAPHIQLLRFSSCWVADTLVMICPEVCDLCTLRWIVGGSLAPGEGVDNGMDL